MHVAVIDIGKPGKNFGWSMVGPRPSEGKDIDHCVEALGSALMKMDSPLASKPLCSSPCGKTRRCLWRRVTANAAKVSPIGRFRPGWPHGPGGRTGRRSVRPVPAEEHGSGSQRHARLAFTAAWSQAPSPFRGVRHESNRRP